MDLNYSPEENAFRQEVRAFLRESLPDTLRKKVLAGIHHNRDEQVAWQKTLYKKGWFAPHWPKEYGGTGWNSVQRYIFEEEYDEAGAPRALGRRVAMVQRRRVGHRQRVRVAVALQRRRVVDEDRVELA